MKILFKLSRPQGRKITDANADADDAELPCQWGKLSHFFRHGSNMFLQISTP